MKTIKTGCFGTINFVVILILLLSACSESGPDNKEPLVSKNHGGIVIPPAIQSAQFPIDGTLHASIYVDNGTSPSGSKQINLQDGQTTVDFKISLSPGSHTVTIKFTFDDPDFGGPISMAEASTTVNVVTGSNHNVNFTAADYTYPDTDKDDIFNLIEVEERTDPLDQASKPALFCSVDNSGSIKCSTSSFTIGGNVSGLSGSGFSISLNGSETLEIASNGEFTFTTPLADQSSYNVTIAQSPASPSQTCVISNYSGSLAGVNVTNVFIECVTDMFSIGGSITNLEGNGLVIQNNSQNNLSLNPGTTDFSFDNELQDLSTYNVTVLSQPKNPDQHCSISKPSGTISGADITNIAIDCVTYYSVGGTVNGLSGSGLVLQNNNGDDLPISTNDEFTFPTPALDGSGYEVTVLTQPSNVNQSCQVANSSGQLNGGNVTNITVTCSTLQYSVGGTVTSLVGSGLVLQNNAGDSLSVSTDGRRFTFPASLADGSGFEVTVLAQPVNPTQTCLINNGSGKLNGADITNVVVDCESWKPVNNGLFGGSISSLAFDPQNSATVYAGTRFSGVYKSIDGGVNWKAVNAGFPDQTVNVLSVDPQNPSTLYAGTSGEGVYKSTDGGSNWSAANSGLANLYINALAIDPLTQSTLYAGTFGGGIFKSTNGGASWVATGQIAQNVYALAIDPQNPTIIYAGTGGGVFKSTSGGTIWTDLGLFDGIFSIAIDPDSPSTIFAGTSFGEMYKSTDGGNTWISLGYLSIDFSINALSIDPQTPSTVYAGTYYGVHKSIDGGTNWTFVNIGTPTASVSAILVDPNEPATLYAGAFSGVFKSANNGDNWIAMNTGITATEVQALSVDPQAPETVYAGTKSGIFKSTNGGTSWSAINSGLPNLFIKALAIDPLNSSTLYAGLNGSGVLKSTDGGANWFATNNGLSSLNVITLSADPLNSTTIYVAVHYDDFGGTAGIYRSSDGGANWFLVLSELTSTIISDPQSSTILYAGTSGNGVFKSTNGGFNWSVTGLTDPVDALAIDPQFPSTLYAAGFSGMFKTTDGSINWSAINTTGLANNFIYTLVIDPQITTTLYAGTFGGVFKTTNGGSNWSPANIGLTKLRVETLAINPQTPSTIYAGTQGDGVFKSITGGQ